MKQKNAPVMNFFLRLVAFSCGAAACCGFLVSNSAKFAITLPR
jgi:hypothetical protein